LNGIFLRLRPKRPCFTTKKNKNEEEEEEEGTRCPIQPHDE
jgi:hypothetical protein